MSQRITFWLTLLTVVPYGSIQGQYISEFHYDNDGAGTGEFVEVFFPDPQPDKPSQYKIYLYNGGDSMSYADRGLQGIIPNCDFEEGGCYYVWERMNSFIQDGPRDGIALVHETLQDTIVFDFISYEGTLQAMDGPVIGLTSTDIGIMEDNSTQVGWSLQRLNDSMWFAGLATKGFVNPIELLSFSGRYMEEEHGILLEWSTATEINNHYFEVQKSLDQQLFWAVGEVAGAGNSQENILYSFFDAEFHPGVVYYRIKQVDYGGAYAYTPVVAIESPLSNGFANVVPMFRGGELYFMDSGYRHAMDLSLYDNLGRLLFYRKNIHSGDVIQVNTPGTGIIFFHMRSQDQAHSGPLLIVDQ